MNSNWKNEFENRMKRFENLIEFTENSYPVSIKVRVNSGCFHRSCCPNAYRIIHDKLEHMNENHKTFVFEEHESGPEILVALTLTAAGISLASNIVSLVNTIIKARFEGQQKGDNHRDPIELIIRKVDKNGEFKEEIILRVNSLEEYSESEMKSKLKKSAEKLLKKKTVRK